MKYNNQTIVLAFGTFDILHPGHIAYLEYAKKHGDRLVVIIARDSSVKRIKGAEPLFSERDRRSMIAALRVVDIAILGNKTDHYESIRKVAPDIMCLGYDHRATKKKIYQELRKRNIFLPKIIRAKKYQTKKYKSSILKRKVQTLT